MLLVAMRFVYKRVGKHCNHWFMRPRARSDTSALEIRSRGGSGFNPSRSGVQTLRSAGLYRYQHVEVDSSLLSLREYAESDAESSVITPSFRFLLSLSVIVNDCD